MAIDPNALFLTPAVLGYPEGLVKTAVSKLGRDPAKWEQEIMSSFHEQHPYLEDTGLKININRSEPEAGALVGQIVVDEKVAIPIIAKDFKLEPFDLFLHEGKLRPMTKAALLDVLQPMGVGKAVEPGEGEISDVSIFNMTQPPFAGKYAYAEALTFTLDQYKAALESMGPEALEFALRTNNVFSKVASSYAAASKETIEKKAGVVYRAEPLAFDGFVTVEKEGAYEVIAGGMQKLAGVVFDRVISLSHDSVLDEKLFCSSEGKVAMAESFGGKPCGDFSLDGWQNDPREPGIGFFWMAKEGTAVATAPLRIHYTGTMPDGRAFIKAAELVPDGRILTILPSTGYESLMLDGDRVFLGKDWNWKSCGETVKVADAWTANRCAWPNCAEIRHAYGRWTLHGESFPELINEGDTTSAFFEKMASYIEPEVLLGLMKEAEDEGVAFFRLTKQEELSGKTHYPSIRPVNLMKEAAFVRPVDLKLTHVTGGPGIFKIAVEVSEEGAEKSVDALLGLNFLNDENLPKFVENLDGLEDASGALSKLLLAARLGLKVEQAPIRTALFSLDEVIRQLRQLKTTLFASEE